MFSFALQEWQYKVLHCPHSTAEDAPGKSLTLRLQVGHAMAAEPRSQMSDVTS